MTEMRRVAGRASERAREGARYSIYICISTFLLFVCNFRLYPFTMESPSRMTHNVAPLAFYCIHVIRRPRHNIFVYTIVVKVLYVYVFGAQRTGFNLLQPNNNIHLRNEMWKWTKLCDYILHVVCSGARSQLYCDEHVCVCLKDTIATFTSLLSNTHPFFRLPSDR